MFLLLLFIIYIYIYILLVEADGQPPHTLLGTSEVSESRPTFAVLDASKLK